LLTVSLVEPERLSQVAVMTDVPALMPDASPPTVIVATLGVPELHVTLLVTSCVLESLKILVALNGCVAPSAIAGLAGVTEIESRIGPASTRTFETKASSRLRKNPRSR